PAVLFSTAAPSGPQGKNGWYTGPVSIALSASDATSGLAATYYSLDGGAQQTYAAPFTVSGDGTHAVSFRSVDKAGNSEAANSLTVKIDGTPPAITAAANPANLWPPNGKRVPVVVSGKITDAASGVDAASATYAVVDDYGVVQPNGTLTVGADGSY